jgi:hypothetical protein
LDKFESRSFDGIFLGYASHSHTYRVLNLETNQVVETCEVTFDETMSCSVPIFDESIFVEENEEDADWGDAEPTTSAALVESAMTTSAHGPNPSSSTTWGPHEPSPHPTPAAPEEAKSFDKNFTAPIYLPSGHHFWSFTYCRDNLDFLLQQ